jgi:uncharacterized membrane protein HdeD (DUF308 family)
LSYEATALARRAWWVFLLTGIAWLIFSLIVFRFNAASIKGIGYLAGAIFIVAGVNEFVMVPFVSTGWKWFHGILGVAFIVVGILAFIRPVNTFVGLAALVAFFLMFAGIFDVILSLTNRDVDLWWLRLICGVVEIGFAFWVAGSFQRSAVFLVAFVGVAALFREPRPGPPSGPASLARRVERGGRGRGASRPRLSEAATDER